MKFIVVICAMLSFASLPAIACDGIQMSDGSCISDPSLTRETPRATSSIQGSIQDTQTWTLIQTLCSPENYNKGSVKYASPTDCQTKQMEELTARFQANVDKNKKKSGSGSSDGGGGGGQQGQGGQGGQQGQGGQGQGQGQQGEEQAGAGGQEEQPAQEQAASSSGDRQGEQGEAYKGPAGSCQEAIKKHYAQCEKDREMADNRCDPSKDKGINKAEEGTKESGALAQASARTSRGATMSALDQHASSVAIKDFAGSCSAAHKQCERQCSGVRKTFQKFCASAPAKDKAEAQKRIAQAEGEQNLKYCAVQLASKASQAGAQASSMGENAEQHAQVNDQSSGQGGGGGGMEGLQGLLGQMQQNNQKKKEETEALKKALEQAAAQESMSVACTRPQFQGLKECQCQGLSSAACAQKMPTQVPNFNEIQNRVPASE